MLKIAISREKIPIVDGSLVQASKYVPDGVWLEVREGTGSVQRLYRWKLTYRGGQWSFELGRDTQVRRAGSRTRSCERQLVGDRAEGREEEAVVVSAGEDGDAHGEEEEATGERERGGRGVEARFGKIG